MKYSVTISLKCPHCTTQCQFLEIRTEQRICKSDGRLHIPYMCTNCMGIITTRWNKHDGTYELYNYYPIVGDYEPRINLVNITNNEVKTDFTEAIDCYNNDFYNACMMMARRAIQQEMLNNKIKGNNLYEQIESTGISEKLKSLLHKVKNFGNHGAHPDFCLFDENEKQIVDEKEFAKLSLEFLDRYFADVYEIDLLVEKAPKSKKELANKGQS